MPTQIELIGNHPSSSSIFGKWLASKRRYGYGN